MSTFNFSDREFWIFIKKTVFFFLLCMIGLYLLGLIYKSVDKYDYDCTRKFRSIPNHIEISNFGNSHGLYGFCYDKQAGYTCFNFGLVSQSLDYDYRILQQYQSNLEEGGVMLIPISYASLFGQDESEKEDFVSKNKRYYKILTSQYIKKYSFKEDLLVDIFPIMGINDNIIYDLITGEERGSIVMDLWEMDLLETSAETINIEAENTCKRHMNGRGDGNGGVVVNQVNVDALYGIIEICKKKNITPILITTPFLNEYVNQIENEFTGFLDEFHDFMKDIEMDTGVIYHDYSCDPRFRDKYDLFFSVDHLNRKGALKFTDVVMRDYVWDELLNKRGTFTH